MPQLTSGDDAISHFDSRNLYGLLTHLGVERQEELALLHGVFVSELGLHGVVSAQHVRDGLIVAQHFLTLEGGGLSLDGLLDAILCETQLGDYSHHSLLLHVFLGERTVDSCCNLSGL